MTRTLDIVVNTVLLGLNLIVAMVGMLVTPVYMIITFWPVLEHLLEFLRLFGGGAVLFLVAYGGIRGAASCLTDLQAAYKGSK